MLIPFGFCWGCSLWLFDSISWTKAGAYQHHTYQTIKTTFVPTWTGWTGRTQLTKWSKLSRRDVGFWKDIHYWEYPLKTHYLWLSGNLMWHGFVLLRNINRPSLSVEKTNLICKMHRFNGSLRNPLLIVNKLGKHLKTRHSRRSDVMSVIK